MFMVAYLFLAWLLYLRKDDFLPFTRKNRPMLDMLGHSQHDAGNSLPEGKVTGEEIADGLIIKDGLVQRRGQEGSSEEFWHQSMYVFLWSAFQLLITAGVLYRFYGIGARFFE